MNGLSDTITLGLVLILVFGSVCLYLYTRIQQAETKINLLESILLDLKMTNELKAYPSLPPPVPADHIAVGIPDSMPAFIEEHREPSQVKPFIDDDEDLAPGSVTGYTDKHEGAPASATEALTQQQIQIPGPASAASNESGVKVSPNYEAMTLKELRDLAKERKLHGTSSLKRSELIDALKQSDSKHSDTGMLESMAVSDITSNAEELMIDA
jgi:Rho termination factor, N-terminal domain